MGKNLVVINCRLAATTKVFLQLEHHTEDTASSVKSISEITLSGTVSGSIKCPYFHSIILSTVNDSKSYVPAVPMIMSFEVLKYFSSSKISFYMLACGNKISSREKSMILFRNLDHATVGLIEKGFKCWFAAEISVIRKLVEYTNISNIL